MSFFSRLSARTSASGGGLSGLFSDLALDLARPRAELVVARLAQPIVEPADMFDRTQAVRRNAQLDALPKRVGDQRHVLQIGQERPLGLVIGVGNIVAHLPALAGQLANPRHGFDPDFWRAASGPESAGPYRLAVVASTAT